MGAWLEHPPPPQRPPSTRALPPRPSTAQTPSPKSDPRRRLLRRDPVPTRRDGSEPGDTRAAQRPPSSPRGASGPPRREAGRAKGGSGEDGREGAALPTTQSRAALPDPPRVPAAPRPRAARGRRLHATRASPSPPPPRRAGEHDDATRARRGRDVVVGGSRSFVIGASRQRRPNRSLRRRQERRNRGADAVGDGGGASGGGRDTREGDGARARTRGRTLAGRSREGSYNARLRILRRFRLRRRIRFFAHFARTAVARGRGGARGGGTRR